MDKITNWLIDIVKQANKLINDNVNVMKKGKDDIVTNCDLKIEKFITDAIHKSYPDYDIVSEEYHTSQQLTDNCFVIDPIDGTLNFTQGIPLWGIQIACITKGKQCASVIYLPKLDTLYYADTTGAWCNGLPISVNKKPLKNLYGVEGIHPTQAVANISPYTTYFRKTGSCSVSFAWTACGLLDAIVFRGYTLWDYIPGQYLVQQAGGYVINTFSVHICACNKTVAENLLKQIENGSNDT